MKTKQQIEEMLSRAEVCAEEPKAFGMTYEEGIKAALEWVLGEIPDDEDILV